MKLNLKRILLWCVMGIGGISLGFYFLYRAFLDAAFLIGILGGIFIIMGMFIKIGMFVKMPMFVYFRAQGICIQ